MRVLLNLFCFWYKQLTTKIPLTYTLTKNGWKDAPFPFPGFFFGGRGDKKKNHSPPPPPNLPTRFLPPQRPSNHHLLHLAFSLIVSCRFQIRVYGHIWLAKFDKNARLELSHPSNRQPSLSSLTIRVLHALRPKGFCRRDLFIRVSWGSSSSRGGSRVDRATRQSHRATAGV